MGGVARRLAFEQQLLSGMVERTFQVVKLTGNKHPLFSEKRRGPRVIPNKYGDLV